MAQSIPKTFFSLSTSLQSSLLNSSLKCSFNKLIDFLEILLTKSSCRDHSCTVKHTHRSSSPQHLFLQGRKSHAFKSSRPHEGSHLVVKVPPIETRRFRSVCCLYFQRNGVATLCLLNCYVIDLHGCYPPYVHAILGRYTQRRADLLENASTS